MHKKPIYKFYHDYCMNGPHQSNIKEYQEFIDIYNSGYINERFDELIITIQKKEIDQQLKKYNNIEPNEQTKLNKLYNELQCCFDNGQQLYIIETILNIKQFMKNLDTTIHSSFSRDLDSLQHITDYMMTIFTSIGEKNARNNIVFATILIKKYENMCSLNQSNVHSFYHAFFRHIDNSIKSITDMSKKVRHIGQEYTLEQWIQCYLKHRLDPFRS